MTNTLLRSHGTHASEREDRLSDGLLLERFLTAGEVESQEAFRILVGRHGPMVFGICRHVLDEVHDAEDAFQATFLVLAQKGGTIRNRTVLAGWLHEVAHRIAIKARTSAARRRNLQRNARALSPSALAPAEQSDTAVWNELRPVLHAEIDRLPDKYRLPVILSYLEGKTNEEVAELLNWPLGTVKGRLSRARDLLRSRLMRRGLTLSVAFLLTALTRGRAFAEPVPAELVAECARRAARFGRRPASSGGGPVHVESPPETAIPDKLVSLMRTDPKQILLTPRPPGWLVMAVVFATVTVGVGVAAASAGGLSNLGSALTEFIPGQFGGPAPPCH